MNNFRRKNIREIISSMDTILERIDSVRLEEEDSYDNLPENLQDSDNAEKMESAIESLDYAYDQAEEVLEYLERACE